MASKLYVVRHGPTLLNDQDRIRGWSNPPLDDKGIRLVRKLADTLKAGHTKVDALYSSDLERTVQTAKIIGEALGIKHLQLDWHFRPWNVGQFTMESSKKAHPEIMKYVHDRFKKVPGGESFEEFEQRFMKALRGLLESHQGENVMLVTHHRGDRVIEANRSGKFDESKMSEEGIDPAGMAEYTVSKSGLIGPERVISNGD